MAILQEGVRRYGTGPSDYANNATSEEKQKFLSSVFRWKSLFCEKSIEEMLIRRAHNKSVNPEWISSKYAIVTKPVGEAESRKTQIAAAIEKTDVEENRLFQKFRRAASERGYSVEVGSEPVLEYCNYNGGGRLNIPLNINVR